MNDLVITYCEERGVPASQMKSFLEKDLPQGCSVFLKEGYLYFESPLFKKPFTISFLKEDLLYRLKTSGKKQPLLKALDIEKSKTVLDVTAGLGRDSLTMAYHGMRVTALESNPLIFSMLHRALEELSEDSLLSRFYKNIEIVFQDAFSYLENLDSKTVWDVVYLDPMYPDEDKAAKSKKDVQFLKQVAQPTENLEALIRLCQKVAQRRVVLKRPPQAPRILERRLEIVGSLVRFDIYFPSQVQ